MAFTMKEAKETLKALEHQCNLLTRQQVTFITALERVRENAHDRIKPVSNLAQVQSYLDYNCNNSTDRGIISLFLEVCKNLGDFCVKLDALQTETRSAGDIIQITMKMLSPTYDLTELRAKYPHDALNHLSCDEALNFYGGIISLIPVVLANVREAVSRLAKLHPLEEGSSGRHYTEDNAGGYSHTQSTGSQTKVTQADSSF
ncbi:sperm acrosome-associated protein 9 [Hyla sarda]|uniref:sperm acrosome-associated protein 9 n=1 Tax=Hyla sarda TaxID=327740 RepID=UPI0024C3ECB0|nr:sperm acrosome-associated protein 9 [Hyla sarda]